jgi:hypothetical protein
MVSGDHEKKLSRGHAGISISARTEFRASGPTNKNLRKRTEPLPHFGGPHKI